MEDQINNGGTPPTPEEARAEARRIADRDRKREQRRLEKLARESSPGFQKRLREESQTEATRRQEWERRSRALLITNELTEPISPDEELEGSPGKSYWLDFFIPELEIFIDENERGAAGSWELLYYRLSESDAGRRVLEFFGVQPLDLSGVVTRDHRFYWAYVQQPEGHPLPTFTNLNAEEQQIISNLKQQWDAGRKAREGWKP